MEIKLAEWKKSFFSRKDIREVDGRWDVDGNVNISEMNFSKIPVKFGKVGGFFDCFECTSLTSLGGAPTSVGSFFSCDGCTSLTSIKGTPRSVGDWFNCSHCTSLTSLEGAPTSVGADFHCYKCGKKFTEAEVKQHCTVKGDIHA